MNISLTPELEKIIKRKVRSGQYSSSSEVIREALRLMDEQDRIRELRLEELRKDIQAGKDSLAKGEGRKGKEVFARLRKKISLKN